MRNGTAPHDQAEGPPGRTSQPPPGTPRRSCRARHARRTGTRPVPGSERGSAGRPRGAMTGWDVAPHEPGMDARMTAPPRVRRLPTASWWPAGSRNTPGPTPVCGTVWAWLFLSVEVSCRRSSTSPTCWHRPRPAANTARLPSCLARAARGCTASAKTTTASEPRCTPQEQPRIAGIIRMRGCGRRPHRRS